MDEQHREDRLGRSRRREVRRDPTPRARARRGRLVASVGSTLVIVAIGAAVFGLRVSNAANTAGHLSVVAAKDALVRPTPGPATALSSPVSTAQGVASCRLAVSFVTSAGRPPKQAGGFLTYPGGGPSGGSFAADPSAVSTATTWAYDAALHRWLPALPGAISPDGHAYIADSTSDAITVVDADHGSSKRLVDSGVVRVLGWANQGIVYLAQRGSGTSFNLLDPQTGASRVLAVPGFPTFFPSGRVEGNALWGVGLNSANASTVVRFDLANGQASVWYTFAATPGSHNSLPQLLGFDRLGHPAVLNAPSGFNGAYQVLLVTAPQQATTIYAGQPSSGFRPAQQAIGDTHGLWMLGTDGSLWLHDAAGLHAIALPSGSPTIAALASACN
jgi:hypothetical protein